MPLTYTILPDLGVVYVKYWGVLNIAETVETFTRFTQDPDFRPDLRHLVDLAEVVEYERSFTELMKLQALKASALEPGPSPAYLIYYAPTRLSLTLAHQILKSWDGLDHLVARVVQSQDEALMLAGLTQRRFADLPLRRV